MPDFLIGHTLSDWMSLPRTDQEIEANFLFRRLNKSGFVTAFYEDAQDKWPPLEQLWVPDQRSASDNPPALYYTKTFMKSRFTILGRGNPAYCMRGESTNQVSLPYLRLRVEDTC